MLREEYVIAIALEYFHGGSPRLLRIQTDNNEAHSLVNVSTSSVRTTCGMENITSLILFLTKGPELSPSKKRGEGIKGKEGSDGNVGQ